VSAVASTTTSASASERQPASRSRHSVRVRPVVVRRRASLRGASLRDAAQD